MKQATLITPTCAPTSWGQPSISCMPFQALKSQPELMEQLSHTYPFVEIYLDPLNDYRITWHYPHDDLSPEIEGLVTKYFGREKFIREENVKDFLTFIRQAADYQQVIIRPEVEEKVRKAWDQEMLVVVDGKGRLIFRC